MICSFLPLAGLFFVLSAQYGAVQEATHESILKKLEDAKLQREYEEALAVLERIPPEIITAYRFPSPETSKQKEEVL